jgi:hypothetical protein
MKKAICLLISTVLISAVSCFAVDVPAGYSSLSEIKDVQARAVLGGKLVVLVIKGTGYSDAAYVEAGFHAGQNAVGGGVEKIFTRPDEINTASKTDFPQGLKDILKKRSFDTSWAVYFVVFDPKMTKVVAEVNASELPENRKLGIEFKKKVQEAKKAIK